MSAGIKKMLAERESVANSVAELDRKWDKIATDLLDMIDRAAPFMDEGSDPTKWPPSKKLKIAYFVGSTCDEDGAEKRTCQFILGMLDKSRKLWADGFHPDPWAETPKRRA